MDDDPIVMRLKNLLTSPLRPYPTPAALIDEWIIINLKIKHRSSSKLVQELIQERDAIENQMRRGCLRTLDFNAQKELIRLVGKLAAFHREMWILEDQVRDRDIRLELRQDAAYKADWKNDERARLKTEINQLFGCEQGSEAKIRPS